MKDLTHIEIGDEVIKLCQLDIYKNTREQDYVEYRALVCWLLREKLHMRWANISGFFISQGKHMGHATAMHLFKKYPTYRKKKPRLLKIENRFLFTDNIPFYEIEKIKYLENKYFALESEYLKTQEKLKHPLVSLVLDVPPNKTSEMRSRIKMIKNAWS